jgi:hypothetical protein
MKLFRSHIRLGSRLALFALAIPFVLSFGHFHGSNVQAMRPVVDAKRSASSDIAVFAAMLSKPSDRASYANTFGPVRLGTSPDEEPDGPDNCAICAAMALANTMVVATSPSLLGPQAAAFLYLTADAEFVRPNSASVAFQPRAPPVA